MAKSGYLMLGAGVLVGAVAMATVVLSPAIRPALAQTPVYQARPAADIDAESLATLRALDRSFASLAEYIEPATVLIRSEGGRQADVLGRRMPEAQGSGSGVIFRSDGWIITNDHVVGGFEKVTVVLSDGRELPGKVTRAEDSDIALVKVDAKELPRVQFADSSQVKPGQFAIAVGSPFGLENTVTVGHVSAVGRATAVPDQRMGQARYYSDMIQTDASINVGNSGGPLLNVDGQVIGINTAIFSGTGGSVGIGFAIPSNQARLIAETLIEKGKIVRGYLGLAPANLKEYQKKELNLASGALVDEVPSDSPSAIAGIKKGDVIVQIGDVKVTNQQELRNSMLRYAPGQTVRVDYIRDGARRTAEVKLGTPPKNPAVTRTPIEDDGESNRTPFSREFRFPDFGLPPFERTTPDTKDEDVAPLREGKARLGVTIENVNANLRKQFNIPSSAEGVVVIQVEPGSVAEKAGLRPGDVIQKLGDRAIKSRSDLSAAMEGVNWGDSLNLKSVRFGENSQFAQDRTITFR